MRKPRFLAAIVLLAVFGFGQPTAAQNTFTFALFERYLNALREQAGIPGLAAAVIQDGTLVWERGFGFADVDGALPVTPDTPFSVTQLTQPITATLLLRDCVESGRVLLDDRVQRFAPNIGDRQVTFRQVLSYAGPGGFQYGPERFSSRFDYLGDALEECTGRPYPRLVYEEILTRFQMNRSVPGGDAQVNGTFFRQIFPVPTLNVFRQRLGELATPYRVDGNRRASVSLYAVPSFTASDGLVASVHDMARWEQALDSGAIARLDTLRQEAWVRSPGSQMGLGWFVQQVNTRSIAWHFGIAPGAYSSLVIKVPAQRTTLILLANSDGLSAQFPLANGDVTVSPFARIFFSLLG